jgi:hypothetical protein
VFNQCIKATCGGGSCKFIDPSETLKPGYCSGQSCSIDDKPHPSLESYITI